MVLKNYFLEPAPSSSDKNRYKLNLSCTEEDVKELVKKLSSISSRPFPSTDKNYDWSFYLYDLTDKVRDKLKSQLYKAIALHKDSKIKDTKIPRFEQVTVEEKKEKSSVKVNHVRLNTEYTFKNFVVGASTRFTYAACKSVAESPGKNYNPLFIYGGVGLGKTHLMHSIGNHVRNKFPDFTIVYIPTGEFIREVVDSIGSGSLKDMRAKYKGINLLLIDDIQFLERSESTQEEFFQIFNEMYEVGKQIVITSDKPPKKLAILEDRLKSRFEWGLTTDIKAPNYETRKAILNKKSEKVGIKITEDINDYIAERLTSNIRELEGIINKIYAYQQLSNDEITLDFIRDIIRNILPDEKDEEVSKKEIKKEVMPSVQQQVYPPPPVPQSPPFMPSQQLTNLCSRCGNQLTFIPQYQKWYCTVCGMYIEPVQPYAVPYQQPQRFMAQPPGIEKRCKRCNLPLVYVSEYNKHYCTNCKEYETVASAPAQVEKVEIEEKEPEPVREKVIKKAPLEKTEKKEKTEKPDFKEKTIGEERENIREIKAGYFLPEGSDELFSGIVDKLDKLTTQKKFNFYIRPFFTNHYSTDMDINYDKLSHMANTNNVDIALFLMPGEVAGMDMQMLNKLTAAMDKENMPFEVITQEEMKESKALNFLLDIAICARKSEKEE